MLKTHTFAPAHSLALDLPVKKLTFSHSKIMWEDFTLIQALEVINFYTHFSLQQILSIF